MAEEHEMEISGKALSNIRPKPHCDTVTGPETSSSAGRNRPKFLHGTVREGSTTTGIWLKSLLLKVATPAPTTATLSATPSPERVTAVCLLRVHARLTFGPRCEKKRQLKSQVFGESVDTSAFSWAALRSKFGPVTDGAKSQNSQPEAESAELSRARPYSPDQSGAGLQGGDLRRKPELQLPVIADTEPSAANLWRPQISPPRRHHPGPN
ncbi:hypothetical protein JZ751_029466 [Albula glossodonta]|uniref:Uncharacterized protein n=1 Tax=Albula glossodonta TaxID=121402 RepID=A0A8T2P940_9TELE|nr:hypothetical protein JZ751_029466 [Albula glossodonta]